MEKIQGMERELPKMEEKRRAGWREKIDDMEEMKMVDVVGMETWRRQEIGHIQQWAMSVCCFCIHYFLHVLHLILSHLFHHLHPVHMLSPIGNALHLLHLANLRHFPYLFFLTSSSSFPDGGWSGREQKEAGGGKGLVEQLSRAEGGGEWRAAG